MISKYIVKSRKLITGLKRIYMWNFMAKRLDLFLMTEFPKSGGTWFCQMLSDASGLPFPRNKSPKFEKCIMQGHHLFHPRMGKCIALVRDGRDVMVSAYFHFLILAQHNNKEVKKETFHRKKLKFSNYENVIENMPTFIEYMFTDYANINRFYFTWSDFIQNVNSYSDKICIIRYESLLENAIPCLTRALEFYDIPVPDYNRLQVIIDNNSFKKKANRDPGQEDRKSFIRKGISGDWKNYFNEEACKVFKHYAGKELILMGYEKENTWTNSNFDAKH